MLNPSAVLAQTSSAGCAQRCHETLPVLSQLIVSIKAQLCDDAFVLLEHFPNTESIISNCSVFTVHCLIFLTSLTKPVF